MLEVAKRLEELADWLTDGREHVLRELLSKTALEKVGQHIKDCREAAAELQGLNR